MPDDQAEGQAPSVWELLSNARFEIGGEDQAAALRSKYDQEPEEEEEKAKLKEYWRKFVADVQIRAGALLRTDTVSFLLGAGASKECGGVLIGHIPLEVEQALLLDGIVGQHNPRVKKWLKQFYLAVARAKGDAEGIPATREQILLRRQEVQDHGATEFPVNFENLLGLLYRWRSALPQDHGRLRLDGNPPVDVHAADIDECLLHLTRALVDRCRLPVHDAASANGFLTYKELVRKVLARPLNLKRPNIFTLNYDTLVEQTADAEGVVLIDGFVGTVRRLFRPESYDQDLYFPADTTEGRVHRLDRVAHLYKLHGSITWTNVEPSWDNPYGVTAIGDATPEEGTLLIYPTPSKFGETLGMPYAELFRRFAAAVVRPQSTLFVLGYGFGDEHVCAILRQALAIPSFTIVIVDPEPRNDFVERLRSQRDRRVWIFSGSTFGKFTGFVTRVLPDLRDEEIRRKVMMTYQALRPGVAGADVEEGSDA